MTRLFPDEPPVLYEYVKYRISLTRDLRNLPKTTSPFFNPKNKNRDSTVQISCGESKLEQKPYDFNEVRERERYTFFFATSILCFGARLLFRLGGARLAKTASPFRGGFDLFINRLDSSDNVEHPGFSKFGAVLSHR